MAVRSSSYLEERDESVRTMLSANELALSARLRRPLKVLIVAHWFPPDNVIGAVRVGKFAKFLYDLGYEVRVIAGSDPEFRDHSLPVEIPSTAVTYLDSPIDQTWRRFNLFASHSNQSKISATKAGTVEGQRRSTSRFRETLTSHYYALIRTPDARAGWIKSAVAAGTKLVDKWRPDLIFASAPPNSSLVAASRIARICGSPWIAELRDLWVENPYYEYPKWRLWLDRIYERRTLRSAAGLVSVTPLWTQSLERKYLQPAICILNGFAPEDFPKDPPRPKPGDVVSLVYTGNIYIGYRDPTALFEAINLLGPERSNVAVHFYGPPIEQVRSFAAAQNVLDRVFVHDRVTYKESLTLQCSADVLLLLQWDNKKDEGNIPAKFFEYLGAGRPILMLGYEHGTLARMVRERNAGLVSNDPVRIAEQLRKWIAQRPQGIQGLDPSASAGMTRHEQFESLERFISHVIDARSPELGMPGVGNESRPAGSANIAGKYD